jgi:hypothetical protein
MASADKQTTIPQAIALASRSPFGFASSPVGNEA